MPTHLRDRVASRLAACTTNNSSHASGQAAGPIDQSYFQTTPGRQTGLLFPNPANPLCQVLIDLVVVNSSRSGAKQPTAEQVPSNVVGNLTFRVANLDTQTVSNGFALLVEVPLDVSLTYAVGAAIGTVQPSDNATLHTFPLNSTLSLAAQGADSQYINTTVSAGSQDFAPRKIFLQPTGSAANPCALALSGSRPAVAPLNFPEQKSPPFPPQIG